MPCWLQYRDLPHTAVLAVTVWEVAEGKPVHPLGAATMRLFSKHGRLKTGTHRLHLWEGQEADPLWPSATPGKQPVQQRGEMGYAAGNMQLCCAHLLHSFMVVSSNKILEAPC